MSDNSKSSPRKSKMAKMKKVKDKKDPDYEIDIKDLSSGSSLDAEDVHFTVYSRKRRNAVPNALPTPATPIWMPSKYVRERRDAVPKAIPTQAIPNGVPRSYRRQRRDAISAVASDLVFDKNANPAMVKEYMESIKERGPPIVPRKVANSYVRSAPGGAPKSKPSRSSKKNASM